VLFVGRRGGLGMRARDWKAGEIPGEDRVRRLCDAGKEELTRGARVSAGQRLSGRRGAGKKMGADKRARRGSGTGRAWGGEAMACWAGGARVR
jgi:hypothetical protein